MGEINSLEVRAAVRAQNPSPEQLKADGEIIVRLMKTYQKTSGEHSVRIRAVENQVAELRQRGPLGANADMLIAHFLRGLREWRDSE